jgi:ABC-type spermidine/putrescine transport system permease subunit I
MALISPTLVFTLLMLAVPLIMVLALSFWTQNYLTLDRSFSLENYKTAWSEPMYQYLMARSLKICDGFNGAFGLSCCLFYFFSCYAQAQSHVDLFDYDPVLDQLSDANFSLEGDLGL